MHTRIVFGGLFVVAVALTATLTGTNAHAACNASALAPVQYGQQGMAVTTLQGCLIEAGFTIPAGATGYYGGQTQTAVQQFYAQEFSMPDMDGRSVGPQGRARLGGGVAQAPTKPTTPVISVATGTCNDSRLATATFGTQGTYVRTLQQCLIDAGFTIPAGATGYYGGQTQTAVKQFYATVLGSPVWHGNYVGPKGRNTLASGSTTQIPTPIKIGGYKSAVSAAEIQKYLSEERSYGRLSGFGQRGMNDAVMMEQAAPMAGATADAAKGSGQSASRVSETNVQIAGIDEPDIVKTDGASLFISRQSHWYGWRGPVPTPFMEVTTDAAVEADVAVSSESIVPPDYQKPDTLVVDAFPLEDLAVASDAIEETGEMLLVKSTDTLVVFSHPKIVAYDVSDQTKPEKSWELSLEDNTSLLTARLLNDEIYLVTQTYLHRDRPCPIVPIMQGTRSISIPCYDILIPERIEPLSHTYTVLSVNPSNGTVLDHVSIAGESGGTVVSMSMNNIYIASRAYASEYGVLSDLMIEVMEPHLPASTIAQARKIQGYDISETGKLSEIEKVLQTALASFGPDERMLIENEAANVFQDKLQERVRDMYRTRIVRIPLATLDVAATGDVPGYLLNQFALDEHNGFLRVAVTVDDGWGGAESMNDVYVLNSNLSIVGSVKDLGLTERIYAVRFIGDTGYIVTFRQIDPFYVLDLRSPTRPKVTGELKIPGYSAYLEPLEDDLILGVGREGGGVKLSVFDVSNPAQPIEKDKYEIKDSWTEVEGNHHAFLKDAKHKVFFMPGSQGGYVFSYDDGTLSLKKTLAGYNVKRAVYIDDNLYVISENQVRVLDETTWEKVATLDLDQ